MNWQPSASLQALRARAELLADIRAFFAERDVLEVDTPIVAARGVTDPHLSSVPVKLSGDGLSQSEYFLQTSPEYAMKRLLAAGSGSIYQIAKVIRDDEVGPKHNPEFTMLEWYRPGFDEYQLMDEIDQLICSLLGCKASKRISYQDAFLTVTGSDPLTAQGIESLRSWLVERDLGAWVKDEPDPDTLLYLAMTHYIEPTLGQTEPTFLYNFPASQSALARIHPDDPRVARRFELYIDGVELANGFYELTDAMQQAQRFAADNSIRMKQGKPRALEDERLLAALQAGLPDCAGVALGLDRLLMLKLGASQISDVLTFPIDRA